VTYSKYYNLDAIPEGWSQDEFVFAVGKLESFSHEQLVDLLNKFEITFSGTTPTQEEELIAVILSDVPQSELLNTLRHM
jgi:hypothetical protein